MSQKRNRSVNWDEEEKKILCSVLKDYSHIIENKSLNTNSNKSKANAWDEVYKKFNELNSRPRGLSQIQIQWKTMKINARKIHGTFKKEITKTGGGTRPPTPDIVTIEVKDLLNPAELLKDHNMYDSDGVQNSMSECVETSVYNTCIASTSQDSAIDFFGSSCSNNQNISQFTDNIVNLVTIEEFSERIDCKEKSPLSQTASCITNTPIITKSRNYEIKPKKVINIGKASRKNCPAKGIKDYDYKTDMISHSKNLKDAEHKRRMEMAEEEHAIKMLIHKEKLNCIILEKEILEIKIKQIELMNTVG